MYTSLTVDLINSNLFFAGHPILSNEYELQKIMKRDELQKIQRVQLVRTPIRTNLLPIAS